MLEVLGTAITMEGLNKVAHHLVCNIACTIVSTRLRQLRELNISSIFLTRTGMARLA